MEGRQKGTRWAGHSLMAIVQFGGEFGGLGQTSMSPFGLPLPVNRTHAQSAPTSMSPFGLPLPVNRHFFTLDILTLRARPCREAGGLNGISIDYGYSYRQSRAFGRDPGR